MPISQTVKSTRRGRHLTKVVESSGDQSLGYHPFKNTSVEKSGEGGALPAALLPNPANLPPAPKRWLFSPTTGSGTLCSPCLERRWFPPPLPSPSSMNASSSF